MLVVVGSVEVVDVGSAAGLQADATRVRARTSPTKMRGS